MIAESHPFSETHAHGSHCQPEFGTGARQPVRMQTFMENSKQAGPKGDRFMLWIDGVGAWQLCVGQSFVIGSPSTEEPTADIALLANVRRKHAELLRDGESWHLQAHHTTRVSGKDVDTKTTLRSGDEICLADRVRLGFRVPSVLSTSAVIDFESDHRPSHSVDGILLMADHCLLGPRADHHIHCHGWPDVVVLYNQDNNLRCRSKTPLTIDGRLTSESSVLQHGSIVQADELRFRVERMDG